MKERIRIKLEVSCLRRQEYGREVWSKMGAGISYTSEHMVEKQIDLQISYLEGVILITIHLISLQYEAISQVKMQ